MYAQLLLVNTDGGTQASNDAKAIMDRFESVNRVETETGIPMGFYSDFASLLSRYNISIPSIEADIIYTSFIYDSAKKLLYTATILNLNLLRGRGVRSSSPVS